MRLAALLLALIALSSPDAACQTLAPAQEGTLSPAPAAQAAYYTGSAVMVEWKGGWYEGHVLEVEGDLYKVGYDGYGDGWDEWVGPERLRPRARAEAETDEQAGVVSTALAPSPSAPPSAAPASAGSPPLGRYVCRQYMTTIGYVSLRPGEVYEVSGVQGRYHYDGTTGEIAWDGGKDADWGWAGRYEHVHRPASDGRPAEHVLRLTSEADGLRIDCYKMEE